MVTSLGTQRDDSYIAIHVDFNSLNKISVAETYRKKIDLMRHIQYLHIYMLA